MNIPINALADILFGLQAACDEITGENLIAEIEGENLFDLLRKIARHHSEPLVESYLVNEINRLEQENG